MNESSKNYYLQAMGITLWQEKASSTKQEACQEGIQPPQTSTSNSLQLDWIELEKKARQCIACQLHTSRKQVVFGVGNKQAKLMIIGEAPGYYEDQQGEPFVGAAGQLLNKMLAAIQLKREEIYIANVLKCRPPNNRDPSVEEVKQCTPFLQRQVQLIKPKLLLALGKVSAHYLLGIDSPMHQLRGQRLYYSEEKIPLIVTYHPAYLLRNPRDKSKSYQDLLLVQSLLRSSSNS